MTQQASIYQAAWGMELSESSVRLVRVAPGNRSLPTITHDSQYVAGNVLSSGQFDPLLLTALSEIPTGEPLGICVPDRLVMCRGFSLPQSTVELTEKMVHAQVAAMLFDGADRLQMAWMTTSDPFDPPMQWIVLCSVRRKWLTDLIQSLPKNVLLRALLPRGLSVDLPKTNAVQLTVDVDGDSTTFHFVAGNRVRRMLVQDSEGLIGVGQWARQVRRAYFSLLQGIAQDRWPTEIFVRAASMADAESLAPRFEETLQLPCKALPGIDAAVASAQIAVVADAPHAVINFIENQSTPAAITAFPKRAVVKAVTSFLLGTLIWYGIDCFRDRSLTRKFEQLHAAESTAGSVDRRLAIGTYLEKNVSPALIIFDAILSSAPSSLSISSIAVAANGQCRLSGMVGSASELNDFMRKLQTSSVLNNVQLRSAKVEQNRWQIDMTADSKPMAGLIPAAPASARSNVGDLTVAGSA